MVSICIYYGEDDWDGPLSLTDMLNIPDELRPIVADYKMNLVQVKKSENLHFQNTDITTVFDFIRLIYKQDYEKINKHYNNKSIDTELALIIGAVTKSQGIIDQALKSEKEGVQMQMCRGLQALEQRGMEAGLAAGRKAGLEAGRTEGIASGKKELLKQQVQKKLAKGKSLEVIADELEEDVSTIQPIIDEVLAGKE